MIDADEAAIELSEADMVVLADLAQGKKPTAEAKASPIADMAARGLLTLAGDSVEYTDELREAFRPMATCKLNLTVLDENGTPLDQIFVGEDGSSAYVASREGGLTIRPVAEDFLPAALAGFLALALEVDTKTAPPNAGSIEAIGASLGKEGLQVQAWAGLLLTKPDKNGTNGETNEYVTVIRTQAGYLWEYAAQTVLAFADTVEDLANLTEDLLARHT